MGFLRREMVDSGAYTPVSGSGNGVEVLPMAVGKGGPSGSTPGGGANGGGNGGIPWIDPGDPPSSPANPSPGGSGGLPFVPRDPVPEGVAKSEDGKGEPGGGVGAEKNRDNGNANDPKGLLEDIAKISKVFKEEVDRMTREGERRGFGPWNNIESIFNNRLKPCCGQSYSVKKELDSSKFNREWKFDISNNKYWPHWRIIGKTKKLDGINEHLEMDPWYDSFRRVQKQPIPPYFAP